MTKVIFPKTLMKVTPYLVGAKSDLYHAFVIFTYNVISYDKRLFYTEVQLYQYIYRVFILT